MLSRLREHFGAAGLIVAVVALSVALAGGAIAANGGAGDGQASASAKKGPRGPKGPKGPKGDTGPQGPAGPAGAKGDTGAAGANGKDGSNGSAGAKGATGATGATGEDGEPWTADGVLPEDATQTGAWAFGETPTGAGSVHVPISFPVQLAAPLGDDNVHLIAANGKELVLNPGTFEIEELVPDDCSGTAAAPTAASGHLCVYIATLSGSTIMASNLIVETGLTQAFATPPEGSAGVAGARVYVITEAANRAGWGSWAVTG